MPFELNVISGLNHLGELIKESLNIQNDEAIAINCIGALRRIQVEERSATIRMLPSLNTRVMTIVEEEADFCNSRMDFLKCFKECLRLTTLYFEMLEESFPPTSNERLMLEREYSRSIIRILSCDDDIVDRDSECWESSVQWSERLQEASSLFGYSNDIVDDVEVLLKRYRSGWSLRLSESGHESGIYLTWKEDPVV